MTDELCNECNEKINIRIDSNKQCKNQISNIYMQFLNIEKKLKRLSMMIQALSIDELKR
jgi:hypothetical protein